MNRNGQYRPISLYKAGGMNRRSYERVDLNVDANICCEPYFFQGRVVNVSEQGMCIHTAMCYPTGTASKLIITGKFGTLLVLQARVTRLAKKDGFNDTMGFELLNPSSDYLEFVNSLRQSL